MADDTVGCDTRIHGTVEHMHICPADPAKGDLDPDFPGLWLLRPVVPDGEAVIT